MRHFTLPGLAALALLGCTVNTYSTPTLPGAGFGAQGAQAGVVGYASGGEEPVGAAPRAALPVHPHEAVALAPRAPRPSAASASAPRFHEQASVARETNATASRADGAQPSSGPAKPSTESAQPSSGSAKPSSEAAKPSSVPAKPSSAATKPSTAVASAAARSVKRPQVARPTGGVVMFARARSSGSKPRYAVDAPTTRAKPKAKTSRASESPRAFAALGAATTPERDHSDERAVLRQDEGGTMQLAKSERSEHMHSADETESLAAQ